MAIYAPNTPIAAARRARTRKAVLFVLFITMAAVLGPKAFAADANAEPVQLDTYTVSSGETLWSIAANLTPQGRDVRDTMAAIQEVNAMDGAQLTAGEQILLPQRG